MFLLVGLYYRNIQLIIAIVFRLYFLTAFSEASSIAAAPSLSPEEFPAVTEPFSLNAGLNFAKISNDVLGRINSSSLNIISSFFLCGIFTEIISSLNLPSF